MIEYEVICENGPEELAATVRTFLADGWNPVGGVGVAGPTDRNPLCLFQAVSREVEGGDLEKSLDADDLEKADVLLAEIYNQLAFADLPPVTVTRESLEPIGTALLAVRKLMKDIP